MKQKKQKYTSSSRDTGKEKGFVRAKKYLGQHFLTDENIARKIADTLSMQGYKNVLEIGPGMGMLTKYLLKKPAALHVIEIDTASVAYLNENYPQLHENIITGNFLNYDLKLVFGEEPFAVTGNFPYNISSQILFKVLAMRAQIPEFSGMFQKEVAQRICEKAGSKTYGILSVLTQAFYDTEYCFTVSEHVFTPPPKVKSGVLQLKRKKNYILPCNEKLFFNVVKTAFNQRRKTLRNSLKKLNLPHNLKEDIIFGLRPEQLSVQNFIALTLKIEHHAFELSKSYLEQIEQLIVSKDNNQLLKLLDDVHYADIAEIIDDLNLDQATYLIKLLDSDKTSDVLTELDDDVREQILSNLSSKEIAGELLELDTDDAADIIAELSDKRKQEVIAHIEDQKHAKNIVELLRYDENSAGGLMAKELVRVNENWNVLKCVKEMRIQAENVTRVHSIYVVDDDDKLKGRLSLKDLLATSTKTHIKEVYIPKVDYVSVNDKAEEVAKIMSKYDLTAIPVTDELGRLVGRITIDDIVDVIKEEAEKDYQLAAGITQEVEADDGIWQLTRARLPWLVLGLLGGLGSVFIMEGFEDALSKYKQLFFFTPLIAAMAGNVGVQSSAIIVQGLANDTVKGSLFNRLIKEVSLSLINGIALGLLVILFGYFTALDLLFSFTIALSMLCVIIVAALIGTFIPILLHKKGIDPAIATGPFITTSNDIFGIFLFFYIAKSILGF